MRRRRFITLLGGATAWPFAARAQQPVMPVIGYLSAASIETARDYVAVFHRGLAHEGFAEGRNVGIEYRWAEGHNDRLPALVEDLVSRQVAVIVVGASTPGALAAKAATKTIPIVFYVGTDPVGIGLVASLAHPDGNVTGVTALNVELFSKSLELIHSLMSPAVTIAVLINPANAPQSAIERNNILDVARVLDAHFVVLNASSSSEIESAFATIASERMGALVVSIEVFFVTQRDLLVALAARYRIPAIYEWREFVQAGGLMSYGSNLANGFQQIGIYAGRILKGEKINDLPVQQATKIELAINLKTAKALGITVPPAILARADEVIE